MEDLIHEADDPVEYERLRKKYFDEVGWAYEQMEDEQVVISAPVEGPHGPMFSIRHDAMCTCHWGVECGGRFSTTGRVDLDGPYVDSADAYVYTGLEPSHSADDKIIRRWIELGRPHEHWCSWWLGAEPDEYRDDEFERLCEEADREWDRLRPAS